MKIARMPRGRMIEMHLTTQSYLIMSLHCDLDLEDSKPIFSQDTLSHFDVPPYQVWLQKVQQLRRHYPHEHLLKFWFFAVALALNTTKQSNLLKRLSSLSHQKKFGCKRISSSKDIVESHNLTIRSLHCNLDLKDNKSICSFRLLMMYHYS